MQREHFSTLHHAVSNATGMILYVFSVRGKLRITENVRPIIETYLKQQIQSVGWDLVSDDALAYLMINNEGVNLIPIVKALKSLIRKRGL